MKVTPIFFTGDYFHITSFLSIFLHEHKINNIYQLTYFTVVWEKFRWNITCRFPKHIIKYMYNVIFTMLITPLYCRENKLLLIITWGNFTFRQPVYYWTVVNTRYCGLRTLLVYWYEIHNDHKKNIMTCANNMYLYGVWAFFFCVDEMHLPDNQVTCLMYTTKLTY